MKRQKDVVKGKYGIFKFGDAHPDDREEESLEQPSPLRNVPSTASDGTASDAPTPPPREQGDEE